MKYLTSIVFILILNYTTLFAQNLNIPVNIQEKDQWCWSACSKSILTHYGINKTQCEIAEYARSTSNCTSYGTSNCCSNPNLGCNQPNYLYGCNGSIYSILNNYANIQTINSNSSLTLAQITTQIGLNRPFVVRWGWYSGGGHFVVGYGVNGNIVNYMNPWFNEGAHISTYTWLVDDGIHTWTHTSIMNKSPYCQTMDTLSITSYDSFIYKSKIYKISGQYKDTIKGLCDTITTLNLTIKNQIKKVIYDTNCKSIIWNGLTCKYSGKYSKTFVINNIYDSIVELNLTINRPKSIVQVLSCDSVKYKNITYRNSIILYDTVFSFINCDTIIETRIDIGHPKQNSIQVSSCKSYIWNGDVYSNTGQYTKKFKTNCSCDSTVTLDLIIIRPVKTKSLSTCDSIILNGKKITSTGLYIDTVKSVCDTIVTSNITINSSFYNLTKQSACNSYTWNKNKYTLSGLYTLKMKTKLNCDSIYALNLTIDTLNDSVSISNSSLTSIQINANSYQWLKCPQYAIINNEKSKAFTPTFSGSFAVKITKGSCIDTSKCINFFKSKIDDQLNSNFELYPNPSSNFLYLNSKFSLNKASEYKIIDIYGKCQINGFWNNINNKIDIQKLSSGIYFLQIGDENLEIIKFEKISD